MPKHEDVCPNCGYCPHCGRSNQQVVPVPVYPMPAVPSWPYWPVTGPRWYGTYTITSSELSTTANVGDNPNVRLVQ